MSKKITYHWGDETLLIKLGSRIQPRVKFLFWAEFIFTSITATVFLLGAIPHTGDWLNVLISIGAAALYVLAAYRFINRLFLSEELLLEKEGLSVIHKTPFAVKSSMYEWSSMGPLHYAGKEKKTDHPLKGQSFDYLGFETQEYLIQSLHHEGNLYFNYEGYPVRFGKGVYSWNAEELVNMMKLYTGDNLQLGAEWQDIMKEMEWDN